MPRLRRYLLAVTVACTLSYILITWIHFWEAPVKKKLNGADTGRFMASDIVFQRLSNKPYVPRERTDRDEDYKRRFPEGKMRKSLVNAQNFPDQDALGSNNSTVTNLGNLVKMSQQKYLIYVCDSARSCGGWGDRQRGLVSTFVLANVTNRTFGIVMTKPCNLTTSYVPNEVNWVIPPRHLVNKSSVRIDDMDSRSQITGKLSKIDFNSDYSADVVYIRTNGEFILGLKRNKLYANKLPAWSSKSVSETFRRGWRIMMKPSEHLQEHLDNFMTSIPRPLVCAHVRMGRSSTIKMDSEVRGNISDLPVLWEFLDRYVKNGSHIFLATDSNEVRNLTRARFQTRLHDTGGRIMHVDKQAFLPRACEGFESALLDQLILTKCDVLVTSKSIFSQRAAYLRGSSENLFRFVSGKISKIQIG